MEATTVKTCDALGRARHFYMLYDFGMRRTSFVILAFFVVGPALGCKKQAASSDKKAPAAAAPAASGKVDIAVTENGFEPAKFKVKAGEPVKLAFTRKTDKTCATEVVLDPGDGQKIEKKLPLNETVEVEVKFAKAGEVKYACGMDMVTGIITVE